jgi:hypothetical protein
MLINGADDRPGITACSHAMRPDVVDKAMAGLVAQGRYVLEWRRAGSGAGGGVGVGVGVVEEERCGGGSEVGGGGGCERQAAVGAFEESLGRWIELEAEREWTERELKEGRGWMRRRMEEWGRRGDALDVDDDAASRFSFEM